MRTVLVRRAVLTASAVSLTLVATACGSGGPGGAGADFKAGPRSGAQPSAAASSASAAGPKGKTAAELGTLLVTPADLPDHKLEPVTDDEAQNDPIETDTAACKPLAQAEGMQPIGASTGVARVVAGGKARPAAGGAGAAQTPEAAGGAGLKVTATSVALVSYDGKGAEEAFSAVKDGVRACAGGFSVTQAGEKTDIDSVTSDTALTGGDETVSFSTVMDLGDGDRNVTRVVVLRKGNTLATFTALSVSDEAEQPKAVVDAQVRKLG
ncbi:MULTISPECIES: hypothetical protein [unclassified Streptomyces]|uniref:hypothetical protein n=1 Tax=unclassified Streptomyces TaxID=2593676 RepID=UPI002E33506E|nr:MULTISPECIES: hypothetical protein [unclassified Streptomyces]WUC65061.1 hypothetical protein OG861_12880 [Streptomyces sp. NBC_00539]